MSVGRATRRAEQLPSGAMFEVGDQAFLAKDFGTMRVLTPPSTELVLEAGYRPWVRPGLLRE